LSKISLDSYYSVGYFLIRKNKSPVWHDEPQDLLPDEIISLESEFCPKFHLSWAWGRPKSPEQALDFGIDETKWDELQQWCTDHHGADIEVWSMFRSTNAIRQFIKQFISESKQNGLTIVGVGLHQSCEDDWKEPYYDNEGVEIRIPQNLPMETGGQVLGFDIASYAHGNFDHTWLSHGHYRDLFQEFGIRPGKYGLLQTREEAIQARDYTDAHDGYVYEYWLLVEYPLMLDETQNT
jgi:hypothetical protein